MKGTEVRIHQHLYYPILSSSLMFSLLSSSPYLHYLNRLLYQNGAEERIIHEDGTVTHGRPGADDNASVRALHRAASPALSAISDTDHAVPEIRVTHEGDEGGVPIIKVSEHEGEDGEGASSFAAAPEGLEKPGRVGGVEDKEGEQEGEAESGAAVKGVDETMSFSTKRLCERWLDNLFMVLYEVLFLRFLFIFRFLLTPC